MTETKAATAKDLAREIVDLEAQLPGLKAEVEAAQTRMDDLRVRGAEDPPELRDSKLTFEERKLGLQTAKEKLADLRPALLLAAEAERIQRLAELFDAKHAARADKAALDDQVLAAAGRFLAALVPLLDEATWERMAADGLWALVDLDAINRQHLPAFRAVGGPGVFKGPMELGGTPFEKEFRKALKEQGYELGVVPDDTPGVREGRIKLEQRRLGHMAAGALARELLDAVRNEAETGAPVTE